MTTFCPQCGAERSSTAAFCAKCGAGQDSATTAPGVVEGHPGSAAVPLFPPPAGPATHPDSVAESPLGPDAPAPTEPPVETADATTSAPGPTSSRRAGKVTAVAAAVVLIALALGTGVLLGKRSPAAEKPGATATTVSSTATTTTATTSTTTTLPPSDEATLLNALAQERLETVRKAVVATVGTATYGLVAFESDNYSQESGALRVWRKDPSGWAQIDRLTTEGEVQEISAADFTGDGTADLLIIVNTTGGRYTSIASSAPCNNTCWKIITFEGVDESEGTIFPTSTLDGTIATPKPGTIVNTLSCSPDCDPFSNVQTFTWSPSRQLFEITELSNSSGSSGDAGSGD